MKSVAGGDQPRILGALQFLGLTDASGKPTQLFEKMRNAEGEDLKKLWREAVRESYSPMFEGFDLSSATQAMVDERFKEAFSVSGDTARKAIAFFLALARQAGVELGPHVKQTRVRSPRPPGAPRRSVTRRRHEETNGEADASDDDDDSESLSLDGLDPVLSGLLMRVPGFDTVAELDEWFKVYKMNFAYVKAKNKNKAQADS
jgi:hypothetical protein